MKLTAALAVCLALAGFASASAAEGTAGEEETAEWTMMDYLKMEYGDGQHLHRRLHDPVQLGGTDDRAADIPEECIDDQYVLDF